MKTAILAAVFSIWAFAVHAAIGVPGDQETFDKGVQAYDAGRYEEAYQIFYELAEKDDLAAMRNVALMLRHGKGVQQDPREAEKWYERAAEAGLVTAQADLGVMLLDGEAGDPDPEQAMRWLMSAAAYGHPVAQYRLAELYEKGTSFMSPDVEAAKILYGAAAARGHKEAAKRLAELIGLDKAVPQGPVKRKTKKHGAKRKTASPPPALRSETHSNADDSTTKP